MTKRLVLRRWAPADATAPHAVELLARDRQLGLARTLARLGAEFGDAAFVVVPIDAHDHAVLESAVEAYFDAGGRARLCLAGSRPTLQAASDAPIVGERVGLLLDDVAVDTPLSELIWDRIEGIRFDDAFVTRAVRSLRLACALEAMLGLARDLGLCTLGADAVPGGGSLAGRGTFDYLPMKPVAARPRAGVQRESAAAAVR